MLHRRRKLWLLAGMSLVLGVAGLALGQEDFSGTYELRPAAAFGLAQKDRVRLHLEKGKSGYELSRTVTHADGSVESWRGTATLSNDMLRCEFPAKRGAIRALERDSRQLGKAVAAYRFLAGGSRVLGSFTVYAADGQVVYSTKEHGTRTREREKPPVEDATPKQGQVDLPLGQEEQEKEQEQDDGDDPRDTPPPVIYGEEIDEGLYVMAFKSLVFLQALDPAEDEKNAVRDFAAVSNGLSAPPAGPSDNTESWSKAPPWKLIAHETDLGVGATGSLLFRLIINESLGAQFAGQGLKSAWSLWDDKCGELEKEIDTGTGPGHYTTSVEVSGYPGLYKGGEFYVCQLDASGTDEGGTDKFPDVVEVLPKRAGTVAAPVIQIDSGGIGDVKGCSLYGLVCRAENRWQLTAVARGGDTGENVPAGYTVTWSGLPSYTVLATSHGQPVTIETTLPPGRWTPQITVTGPDPLEPSLTITRTAAIHSLVVELRPTCNVGPATAGGPSVGTPFGLRADVGGSGLDVDVRLGVAGSMQPGSTLGVRGRVSLDGYPQNEYWVTADDVADLPQYVTVATGQSTTYFLQGYQLASTAPDDLKLQVFGQAQIEKCEESEYFRYCDGCQPPDEQYPVEVEWQKADTEPFNSVYPVEWYWDEPALDHYGETPDEIVVPADHVELDDAGGAAMSRVNFIAEVAWEGAEISADYYGEDLELVWHASADPGNTFCKTPGLLDLHATANTSRSGSLRTVLRGLTSYVQLDFSAQIAGGEWKAKAGDAFTLVPHGSFAHSDLGERFWKTRKVTLEAGAKLIHVTVPSTYSYEAVARHLRPALQQDVARFKANPDMIFDMSAQALEDFTRRFRWFPPPNPGERDLLVVYFFDRFGNRLPEGVDTQWALHGGGQIGVLRIDADRPQESAAEGLTLPTDAEGRVRIEYVQENYPTCAWQPSHYPASAMIQVTADGLDETANFSKTTNLGTQPVGIEPLEIYFAPQPGTPDFLDIARGDSAVLEARVTRGSEPAEGVTVRFTSVNGDLSVREATTDAQGIARVTLLAHNARVDQGTDGHVLVTAAVNERRDVVTSEAVVRTGGTQQHRQTLRWIDSSPIQVHVEEPLLVYDAPFDGHVAVPTLPGFGNATPDVLNVPYKVRTKVTVRGPPLHKFRVNTLTSVTTGGSAGGGQVSYPFDQATGNSSPSTGGPAARLRGDAQVAAGGRNGTSALRLGGQGTARIPAAAASSSNRGIRIAFWVKPDALAAATLLEQGNRLRLEADASGFLSLTVGSNPPLLSDAPLQAGAWNYVELRLSRSSAQIAVGTDPAHVEATYRAIQAIGGGGQVVVGERLVGLVDDLEFAALDFDPDPQVVTGLDPDGTVTTNAQGVAIFYVNAPQPTRPMARNELPNAELTFEVIGSTRIVRKVWSTTKNVFGQLWGIAEAFFQGEQVLHKNEGGARRVAATIGSWIPLIQSVSTLFQEIYKAAVGCDEVSYLNLTFATVGILLDTATLGTARLAAKSGLIVVRWLLIETAQSGVFDGLFRLAIAGIVRLFTQEVADADGTHRAPRQWVLDVVALFNAFKELIQDPDAKIHEWLNAAVRSVQDLFVALRLVQLGGGAEELTSTIRSLREVERDYVEQDGLLVMLPQPVLGGDLGGALLRAHVALGQGQVGLTPAARAAKAKQVVHELVDWIAKHSSTGSTPSRQSRAGLRRLVELVAKEADGDVLRASARVRFALAQFTPAGQRQLLEDFNELYVRVGQVSPAKTRKELRKALQTLAGELASNYETPKSALSAGARRGHRSRTKGAAYHINNSLEALRPPSQRSPAAQGVVGTLIEIEPKLADDASKQLRDAIEQFGSLQAYVELKAVERLSARAVGKQIRAHFRRLGEADELDPDDLASVLPVLVRAIKLPSNPSAFTARIRKQAVEGVMEGLSAELKPKSPAARAQIRAKVEAWVQTNISLQELPLKYPMN